MSFILPSLSFPSNRESSKQHQPFSPCLSRLLSCFSRVIGNPAKQHQAFFSLSFPRNRESSFIAQSPSKPHTWIPNQVGNDSRTTISTLSFPSPLMSFPSNRESSKTAPVPSEPHTWIPNQVENDSRT